MADSPNADTNQGGSTQGRHKVIATGEFPFPVLPRGCESRQLVWVRHHANYMAGRGWLDYVRAISVLIRGAIVNILIGLPFLILVALGVAALSVFGWGFRAAAGLIVFALAWVILAPIGERLWAVVRIKNTVDVGTNSTVATRDRLERAFGALVILIVVAAVFESMSFFLDDFHFWTREQPRDGRALASLATFSLAFLSSAGRVLPRLRGKAFKAAVAVVGLVGAVSPLLVVMFVADTLVYTGPTASAASGVAYAGLVLGLIIGIGIVIGMLAGALSRRSGAVALAVTLGVAFVLVVLVVEGVDAVEQRQVTLETDLAELDLALNSVSSLRGPLDLQDGTTVPRIPDDQFRERVEQFRRLTNDAAKAPLPELTKLVDFLDQGREEVAFTTETVLDDIAVVGADAVSFDLRESYPSLSRASSGLPRLNCLVEAVALGTGDAGAFETATADSPVAEDPCCPFSFDDCFQATRGHRELSAGVKRDLGVLDERMFLWNLVVDAAVAPAATGQDDVVQPGSDGVGLDVLGPEALGSEVLNPEVLVREVLTQFDDTIITANFGPARDLVEDFPALSAAFPETFLRAEQEIGDLGRLLREVRVETHRLAIFSSQYPDLRHDGDALRVKQLGGSAIFALMLAGLLWAYVWIAVDPNRTSLHRLYRDRLAMAFLVGADTKDDVDVEEDLDLGELSRHEAGSIAPYHLVNAAINLPRSKNIDIQDRKSDFFIFSKRFVGSERTGYCRSETMERAFPDMSLSTAMAVSGAAASPAMGRMTQPALVALMTILNIRLGFWIPNPGRLEKEIGYKPTPEGSPATPGFTVDHVLAAERREVERRWKELGSIGDGRSWERGLVGLACSGGGIRSATLNLGISQALHQTGVFDHVDYLSTVSGGGFFGSSVSSAMRSRVPTRSNVSGSISAEVIEVKGGVQIEVVIEPSEKNGRASKPSSEGSSEERQVLRFGSDATLLPEADPAYTSEIKAGTRLLDLGDAEVVTLGRSVAAHDRHWWRRDRDPSPFSIQFRWRAKPTSLLREFAGNLDELSRWVNVSDGGHIENLGVFELLRRRCRFIIVGDAEFDPNHEFGSLTTVMRAARLELDTRIEIDLATLRPDEHGLCAQQWAIGRIRYPEGEPGYLLYLKSSLTKDEDQDIVGYQVKNPLFPHQSTADQFFDEGQFEAYRRLGYRIARSALERHELFEEYLVEGRDESPKVPFDEVRDWFGALRRDPPNTEVDDAIATIV